MTNRGVSCSLPYSPGDWAMMSTGSSELNLLCAIIHSAIVDWTKGDVEAEEFLTSSSLMSMCTCIEIKDLPQLLKGVYGRNRAQEAQ